MSGWASLSGRGRHLALGGALTLAVALGAAALSAWPSWQVMPADTAVIHLSLTHSGVRNCRPRTEDELAKLPKNMRTAEICERRRAPVRLEMHLDGQTVVARDLAPSGLAGSGPSRLFTSLEVPAGTHEVALRMQDDPAAPGPTQQGGFTLDLSPGQSVAIDFDPTTGRFFLH